MIKQIFPFAMSRSAALLAWAALLALLCSPALAIDPFQTDDVTRLTGPTFKEAVSDGRIHFIKFYLPRQGDSQKLAPLWMDLAAHHHVKGDDRISVSVVDCSQEENVELCQNMTSFPLFKIFSKGYDIGTYKGALDLDTMRDYVLGAAHYLNPIKGNWFVEKVRSYFKLLRQAYTAKPHNPHHARRRREKHSEL